MSCDVIALVRRDTYCAAGVGGALADEEAVVGVEGMVGKPWSRRRTVMEEVVAAPPPLEEVSWGLCAMSAVKGSLVARRAVETW